ncbi:MAG: type IV secretion system protein [Pseudomonadota bacterium]|uniref:type IV secretion system protein n=1 Tax=Phenylobacterium sp. TaxID=1871053 RepID=UPI0025EBC2CC|nr:type IV secretion system protein [Phenylobacterium sp.]MBT9471328.1 type IV secretion system protein [Phenylobacterium sp.]
MKSLLPTFIASAVFVSGGPAAAQVLVHDPAAVTQLITQAQTAVSQLQKLREQVTQAERLYESFNDVSNVNAIAGQLLTPELRRFVPGLDKLEAAARGDLKALGELAVRAEEIRATYRAYTPAPDHPEALSIEAAGARGARDMALGEEVTRIAEARLDGLDQLREALDDAPSARAVMDISARLASEQAMIQNDQMRLQGVMMMQLAEDRLAIQRQREEAIAARELRMDMFRRGFTRP